MRRLKNQKFVNMVTLSAFAGRTMIVNFRSSVVDITAGKIAKLI